MSYKQAIIKGTFILTLTGFATRFMGFFYRIFLSHTFGEEGVGLYQLIFPIYALCFSLTCAGIELALSRLVARCMVKDNKKEARTFLYTGLLLTLILSFLVMIFIQTNSSWIAANFLKDLRCKELLVVLSYALPFAAIHSCICGYYFGLKETKIPASSQLIEQCVRISSVFLLYQFGLRKGIQFSITIAVAGLVFGEIASSVYCFKKINSHTKQQFIPVKDHSFLYASKELLALSIPLTGSRVLLNLLQSIEAVSIPTYLQYYGLTPKDALSIYGVLTGMALPCILFPSAITNSISTMLLPTMAEIQALNNRKEMVSLVKKVSCSCIFLGSICCVFLLLSGNWIGNTIFHSEYAGAYICTLAWMCPFLYTNTTLISMINGIGKTHFSFLINAISLCIRIASVFLFIPRLGITGYLWGLFGSQICIFCSCLIFIVHYLKNR